MTLTLFLVIILGHYVANFLLQPDVIAQNKYNNIKYLIFHCIIYAITFFSISMFMFKDAKISSFIFIVCFISHLIIDFISSKITHYYYMRKRNGAFFNTIGLDQVLHYIVLYFTFITIK